MANENNENFSKVLENIFEIIDLGVKCLAIIAIWRAFGSMTFTVSGESMMNTLHDKDRMIVTSFMYEPKYGDIVVIPHTHAIPVPIIKRVIATAGQTLKIDFKKNKVYVDGNLLDEPYISSKTVFGDTLIPEKIPEGFVFVMGDNRAHSTDSRFEEVGLVSVDDILGKAQFTIWPPNRFGSPY